MIVKYTGLAPVTNVFGEWKHGDTKYIPDGTALFMAGFEIIEKPKQVTRKTQKYRSKREKLHDKMERHNEKIEEVK